MCLIGRKYGVGGDCRGLFEDNLKKLHYWLRKTKKNFSQYKASNLTETRT
jgi:hypothetical protein